MPPQIWTTARLNARRGARRTKTPRRRRGAASRRVRRAAVSRRARPVIVVFAQLRLSRRGGIRTCNSPVSRPVCPGMPPRIWTTARLNARQEARRATTPRLEARRGVKAAEENMGGGASRRRRGVKAAEENMGGGARRRRNKTAAEREGDREVAGGGGRRRQRTAADRLRAPTTPAVRPTTPATENAPRPRRERLRRAGAPTGTCTPAPPAAPARYRAPRRSGPR